MARSLGLLIGAERREHASIGMGEQSLSGGRRKFSLAPPEIFAKIFARFFHAALQAVPAWKNGNAYDLP